MTPIRTLHDNTRKLMQDLLEAVSPIDPYEDPQKLSDDVLAILSNINIRDWKNAAVASTSDPDVRERIDHLFRETSRFVNAAWVGRNGDEWLPSIHSLTDALLRIEPFLDLSLSQQVTQSRARHSDDFRSVFWFGKSYVFSPNQAACVRVLWKNWQNQTPVVGEASIQEEADVNSAMRGIFHGHPAWETMIVRAGKGALRLEEFPEV